MRKHFEKVFFIFLITFLLASCGAQTKNTQRSVGNPSSDALGKAGASTEIEGIDYEEPIAENESGTESDDDDDDDDDATTPVVDPPAPPAPPPLVWKAVLLTGDDSINAFDNAREDVGETLIAMGVDEANIRHLSRNSRYQNADVGSSSLSNLEGAFEDLDPQDYDICLLHMTSHGSRTGFYMRGQSTLLPSHLDEVLTATCGDRPTIALISACYSGVFINDDMKKDNRIILTAARADKTSFGCSPENEYTYWDGCLLDYLATAETFEQLYDEVTSCIERKEGNGNFSSSQPQAFFGSAMIDYPLPGFGP